MTGKLKDLYRGLDGQWVFSISTPFDPRGPFDELKDDLVDVTIKKHRNKRSLDANAFAWVLIDKLAAKLSKSKVEVYRETIREIGGVSDVICVQNKAVERLVSGWEKNGIGWQTDTSPSKIEGCTNVTLYYGSSTYDTYQQSRLIDLLVQECEQQGIPTILDDDSKKIINNAKEVLSSGRQGNSA